MSLLRVENLVTCLNSGAGIVDGISFEIAKGETFALLGESGCGKSMTALSLMRLLPDGVSNRAGRAELGQTELFGLPEFEMQQVRGGKMAMIFQEPGLSLNPVMTVGAQIAEVLRLHQPSCTQIEARCIELLGQVGIPDPGRRIHEYPFQLSGGMKQRVMIAMALAGSPGLLIADEPTTALDVTIQAQVLQLLRETQAVNGMAMLLITHDLGVVAETAHRVGVMYAGQIVEQGGRERLFSRPLHPYTQKLFDALPSDAKRGKVLAAIAGSVPPPGSIERGCRYASRCDHAWELCRVQDPGWTTVGDGAGVRCFLYGDGISGQGDGAGEKKAEGCETGDGRRAAGDGTVGSSAAPVHAAVLKVQDLKVHFPIRKGLLQRIAGRVKAVDGVSLEIEKGRTLALVGESGCGKTTLGKALLHLIEPTSGSVSFDGREQTRMGESGGMQMVFQDPYASLNPRMRIAEILEEGMSALHVGENGPARQAHIDALLDKVGLAASAKWRYPHEFSGGQRQRIAIARALAVSPSLLICDEPTSALDVSVQAQILNLLKSLQQELQLSYLFITHNLAVVEYLAHEVCVMYLGRIVERGSAEDVLRSPAHPYTRALLAAVPRIDGKRREYVRLEGDLPSPANPPQGCHFAPRCPIAADICRAVYPESVRICPSHAVHCHFPGKIQVDGMRPFD